MRLLITRAESVDLTPDHQPLSPGELVAVDRQSATVACGRGGLRLLEVQPEGKKRMPMGDFLRGHPMRPGDRLGP